MIQFAGDRLKIEIDFLNGIPIYEQIALNILGLIERDELKTGDQLPTIRALAEDLGVNFNTVARSYRMLDQSAVISTQQGRGTYIIGKNKTKINKKNMKKNLEQLTRFYFRKATYLGYKPEEIKDCFEEIFQENE
jgi:GntR family transcriptional regulator